MTALSDILPEVYGPVTLTIDGKPARFLRHLALIGGAPPAEFAKFLLLEKLNEEAVELVNVLTDNDKPLSPPEVEPAAAEKLKNQGVLIEE